MLQSISVRDGCVLGCFLFLGVAGAIPGIAPNQASEMTGVSGSAVQVVVGIGSQLLVDLFLLWFVYAYRKGFKRVGGAGLWALLFAGWAILSGIWSQSPWLTLRHAVPFAMATAFGLCLVEAYPMDRLLALLTIAFTGLAIWSAVLAVGFPAIGLDASSGHTADWQGAFSQKNACGRAMVFALAGLFASGIRGIIQVGLACTFLAVLVMSGSRGAWLIGSALIATHLGLKLLTRFSRASRLLWATGLATGAVAVAVCGAMNFAAIAPLVGRDATLTGRTEIWRQVWLAILERPLCGYGFSAFWQGTSGACWNVVVSLGFILFHAHNGFLEIWLELGAVGLLLFAGTFLRALVLTGRLVSGPSLKRMAWPVLMLALIVLYDLEENTLLAFNGLYWVLYVAALAELEKSVSAQPARAESRAREPMRLLRGLTAGATPWL